MHSALLCLSQPYAAFLNLTEPFSAFLNDHPEVIANSSDFKFRGRGQRDTPVTDVRGIVEIIMLLPGQQAARLIVALVACILPWDAAPGVDGEAMDVCRHRVLERQTDELDIVMPP